MSHNKQIMMFWEWFAANAEPIRRAYNEKEFKWLSHQIAPRLKGIEERLSWEIGPYDDSVDTFVIAPTVQENLPLTRAAVAMAPPVEGWRFLPAKPPKELTDLTFMLGSKCVNANDWRYVMVAFNEGEFVDVELFLNAPRRYTVEDTEFFCELVVEALVGEECRLDRIGYLTHQVVEDNTIIQHSTAIEHLREHLDMVLAPSQDGN